MWEVKVFQGRRVKPERERQSFFKFASEFVVCTKEEERTDGPWLMVGSERDEDQSSVSMCHLKKPNK